MTIDAPTRRLADPCDFCIAGPGQKCEHSCPRRPHAPATNPTNDERAEYADAALDAYAANHYHASDSNLTLTGNLEQAARDLVSNLLHRLDRAGLHPGHLLHAAYTRYAHEQRYGEPGYTRPTAYTFRCDPAQGCGAASGQACAWSCPTWRRPPVKQLPPPADASPSPAPASGQVVVTVELDVSEDIRYSFTANLIVPAGVADDQGKLYSYLDVNEHVWLAALDPAAHSLSAEWTLNRITIR